MIEFVLESAPEGGNLEVWGANLDGCQGRVNVQYNATATTVTLVVHYTVTNISATSSVQHLAWHERWPRKAATKAPGKLVFEVVWTVMLGSN